MLKKALRQARRKSASLWPSTQPSTCCPALGSATWLIGSVGALQQPQKLSSIHFILSHICRQAHRSSSASTAMTRCMMCCSHDDATAMHPSVIRLHPRPWLHAPPSALFSNFAGTASLAHDCQHSAACITVRQESRLHCVDTLLSAHA